MPWTKGEYTCAECGGRFEKAWSDEDAEKEMRENFGTHITTADCDVLCDDCYRMFMRWRKSRKIKEDAE